MKKISLILIIAIALFNCKKKDTNPSSAKTTTTQSVDSVYCLFIYDNHNQPVFYDCAKSLQESQQKAIEIRDKGLFQAPWKRKANCLECY